MLPLIFTMFECTHNNFHTSVKKWERKYAYSSLQLSYKIIAWTSNYKYFCGKNGGVSIQRQVFSVHKHTNCELDVLKTILHSTWISYMHRVWKKTCTVLYLHSERIYRRNAWRIWQACICGECSVLLCNMYRWVHSWLASLIVRSF